MNVLLSFVVSRFFRTESRPKEPTKTSNEMRIQVSQVKQLAHQQKTGDWAESSKYNR